MRKAKKIKHIIVLVLALALLGIGTINFNANALANLAKSDGLLYITDNGNVPESINVYQGKDSNKQDKYDKLDIHTVKSSALTSINADAYKYASVDGNLINNSEVKAKLLDLYKNGGTVIIKKTGIKLKDVYQYFDVHYTNSDKFASDIDSQQSAEDKLKVIGISIFRDSEGVINTNVISAENYSNEEDINKAIANSIKLRPTTSSTLVKQNDNKILSLRSSTASASDPGWDFSASNSWSDNWTTVTIGYSAVLKKNPNNPDSNGKYYFLEYAPMTLTPTSAAYYIGKMSYYKDGAGAVVWDYGPKPQPASSTLTVSVGAPLSASFSFPVGTIVELAVDRGIGTTSTQWNFTPTKFGIFQPVSTQLSFELINCYRQSSSSFKIGNAYTVKMYKLDPFTGTINYYGDAAKSGRYVSGI